MTMPWSKLDRAEVVRVYKIKKNLNATAEALGVTPNAIKYQLRQAGVEIVRHVKQRRWKGERIEQVREVLGKHGPLTLDELVEEMDAAGYTITYRTLLNHISRWRRDHGDRWIRIAKYQVIDGYRRTIYGLGPYPDAVPVVRTQADYSREWRKNNLALCRARGRKTPASPWAGLGA